MMVAPYESMSPNGLVGPKFERQDERTQEEIEMLMNEVPDYGTSIRVSSKISL